MVSVLFRAFRGQLQPLGVPRTSTCGELGRPHRPGEDNKEHVTDDRIVKVHIKSRIVTVEGPRGMRSLQKQKPEGHEHLICQ